MDIKIEMVLRKSTLADIIGPWVAMGKPDNREAGGFIFDNVVSYNYIGNHIDIHTEDATSTELRLPGGNNGLSSIYRQ